MTTDEKYMRRCLQLAENGRGFVAPNPMVGAVVVCNDRIIGEGFHREYGKAHAEVNAVNAVKDKSLLKKSTVYVSLEPCAHYGKTPPCAQLLIDLGIPRVVIAVGDPFPQVSGQGVRMLREAGAEVITGVLEAEARVQNKAFFCAQTRHRPYVYLKWAQTKDGFIDKLRVAGENPHPTPVSNDFTQMLVHKMRAETPAILIGTNTAINDNPSLTTRYWHGKNPVRVILDRQRRIPACYRIFDGAAETLIFTETVDTEIQEGNVRLLPLQFDGNMIANLLAALHSRCINALLVEGGRSILQSFIDSGIWDEAFIEISETEFGAGTPAPVIRGKLLDEVVASNYRQQHWENDGNG
ncbi:MAG: bifunctional diaminohydroxyphosphoribosylaminopyrimidine deaminase/5-amino-6-(5-phosphoribosylamino)uracil reductase RibD [Prevotella sp.]|jgi:diaminohydroxyphosphoribosylaminopyrimidine deaminase/5-amino-6-(5-phosphoribosylamino)uracil reductase|nr:bifunctional diaminohydroxyphosphoribosylaminopyrimidine deaminase/5-amino-6-(5-phosphoribosylamino)uracil reductase RibD [Prevotella sp.]